MNRENEKLSKGRDQGERANAQGQAQEFLALGGGRG